MEDFGVDDEVKEYKQEDGEDLENGVYLDFVNDIKLDLIKKEIENLEVSKFFYFLIFLLSYIWLELIVLFKLVDFCCVLCFGCGVISDLVVGIGLLESGEFKVLNIELYCLGKQ